MRRTASLIATFIAGTVFASFLAIAWQDPTADAPGNNVGAPINVGPLEQIKSGALGLDGLAVFGTTLLSGTSGSNAYLNFGTTSDESGYGLRDNGGTLEFKNSGGVWKTLQTIVTEYIALEGGGGGLWQSGADGAIYYNGGNVGIGIATSTPPAAALDIAGGIKLATTGSVETCDASKDGLMVIRKSGSLTVLFVCDGEYWQNINANLFEGPGDTEPIGGTHGYFVVTQAELITSGNLGGLSGANELCLQTLQYGLWKGWTDAVFRGLMTAGKVRAWLCNGSTCQNGQPNTQYKFAGGYNDTDNSLSGGDSFTTNASGLGPNDSSSWNTAGKFGTALYYPEAYWTGRANSGTTIWPNSSHANTCNGWTSTSGTGRAGDHRNGGGTARWSFQDLACSSENVSLVCFVDP